MAASKRQKQQPTAWQVYQAAVRAQTDLTNGDRVMFDALVRHADHKTGANCAPPIKDLAEELGWKPRRVKKYLHRLTKTLGLIEAIPLRSRRGWAQNLYRFIGYDFVCPRDSSKLKHLRQSHAPRTRHDATGRFVGSRTVTVARVTDRDRSITDLGSRTVTDMDLAVTEDLALDLVRAVPARSSAAEVPKLRSEAQTTPELEREVAPELFELWLQAQLDEPTRTYDAEGGPNA